MKSVLELEITFLCENAFVDLKSNLALKSNKGHNFSILFDLKEMYVTEGSRGED